MSGPSEVTDSVSVGDVGQRTRRLLFVGKNHLPHIGGSEVSTHHLMTALHDEDNHVRLLTRLPRRSVAGGVGWAAARVGLRPEPRGDVSLGYLTERAVDPISAVRSAASQAGAEAVVVTCGDPVFARSCLEAVSDLPSLLYVRDARSASVVGTGVHADVVVTNSRFVATRVRELGRVATYLPSVFPRAVYEVEVHPEAVLFVNPTPRKGVDMAFAVAAARPDIPFVFRLSWRMKRGALREVRARARRHGNVEVLPATTDPAALYGRCRVVLVPSVDEEAWCRVVSEAQINAIPSVASALGGFPESLGPGGVLVDPPTSLEAWVTALSDVWDDPARYAELSRLALEHSKREELDPGTVTRRFEGLVEEAIERHGSCRDGATG